ncbi:MAG: zincin-like metallopeptidase domain-containing protein, partial [Balneolaceae bacterium]
PDEDDYRENRGVQPEEIYQTITDRIINTIKEVGHLPWQKEWKDTGAYGGRSATNFVSKKGYRGINYFLLNFKVKYGKKGPYMVPRELKNPYFLTFNQVNKLNGKIKKDTKGEMVIYFTKLYRYRQLDPVKLEFTTKDKKKMISWLNENRNDIELFRDGFTAEEIASQSYIPVLKYYNVFNGEHIEGIDWGQLPSNDNADLTNAEKIQVGEAIIEAFPKRPVIKHEQPKAFYTPAGDFINMPKPGSFSEAQYYYTTLFHEAIHSTGHPGRLGRDLSGRFGTQKYAFEELIAEMGAVYLCAESGILFRTIDNSAKYLNNWNKRLVKELEDDNKFYFRAASRSQEAADFILDRDDEGVPAYLKGLDLDGKNDSEPEEKTENVSQIGIPGKNVSVDFKADGSEKHQGRYQLIEAADLTASHNKDCSPNSKHRISRGQPRDRGLDNLCAQPKFIAKNLNPDSITHGNLAFQGAPVTTADGMVIQGNGRSISLNIAYDEIKASAKKYKDYLGANASQFGFKKSDVTGMKQPVLVRMLEVNDKEAIRLGNVVDTSQAKMNRIDQAKAIIRGLKPNQLQAIGRIIGSSQGETIGAIIDDIGIQIFDQVKDLDRTGLIEKNELTADGKEFLRSVLTGIIFDSEENKAALRDFLDNPHTIQAGIERSYGSIIPLINQKGDIRTKIQQAVSITAEIKRNEAFDSVEDVMSSQDMFSGSKTYSRQAQDLARFFLTAKTQKEIRSGFRVYVDHLNGRDDLFDPIKATSQAKAFKAAFVVRKNPVSPLAYMGITERITISDGSTTKELKGKFPS